MFTLKRSLAAWGNSDFNSVLKDELQSVAADQLPLQAGLSLSSALSGEPFTIMVITAQEKGNSLWAKVGVFYTGIIAGCSCADDPTPTDLQNEYCELELLIDRATAVTAVTLLKTGGA